MPGDNEPTPLAAAVDPSADLRVRCYVRSSVPVAIAEAIDEVVERVERLCEHGCFADYEVTQWPPQRQALGPDRETDDRTRRDLLATFERWADRNGYSLEPAFRRREVPSLLPEIGPDEPRERVQVPIVALALYEGDADEIDSETRPCGVVPYTEGRETGADRTYSVPEWLAVTEREAGVEARSASETSRPTRGEYTDGGAFGAPNRVR